MSELHTPDPRFVEGLEWHLSRELRRRRADGYRPPWHRAARMTAVVLVSVAVGALTMGVTQEVQETWRRELLETRLAVQLQMAEQRLAMYREAAERARERADQGLMNERDVASFDLQVAQAQSEVASQSLDLEEVRRSGRAPLRELSAPEVDGRDFVSERLQVGLELARRHVTLMRADVERMRQRVEVGLAGDRDVRGMELAAAEAEQHLARLERELEIRERFLEDDVSAVEAELLVLEAEAERRLEVLSRQDSLFALELEHARSSREAGVLDAFTLTRMEAQVAEHELQRRLAEAELGIVRRELERSARHR